MATKKAANQKKHATTPEETPQNATPTQHRAPRGGAVFVLSVAVAGAALYGGYQFASQHQVENVSREEAAVPTALMRDVHDQITLMGDRFMALSAAVAQLQSEMGPLKSQLAQLESAPPAPIPAAAPAFLQMQLDVLSLQAGALHGTWPTERVANMRTAWRERGANDEALAALDAAQEAFSTGVRTHRAVLESARQMEAKGPAPYRIESEDGDTPQTWQEKAKKQFSAWVRIQKVKDYEASQSAAWQSEWAQLRRLISQGKTKNAQMFFEQSHLKEDERLATFAQSLMQFVAQQEALRTLASVYAQEATGS